MLTFPVVVRAVTAARIPTAAHKLHRMSAMPTYAFIGGPSASPVKAGDQTLDQARISLRLGRVVGPVAGQTPS